VLLLKRSVPRDKAPRITVNGSLATLAALQRLGEHWVDFHGPSEPRRLLKENCQLELLDLYGRANGALADYGVLYRAWRERLAERERLVGETKLSPEQVEFLRNQLAKMDALELSGEAIEALERDFQRQHRAQELTEIVHGLAAGLTGEEGLQGRLGPLLREARRLAGLDAAGRALAERLNSAAIELNELGAEFDALGREFQFDPEQAELLAGRMNTWLELKR
jgi:DNA repair protein RecN (Recombination protein N)